MPTVKISELPTITEYSTNTEATLVVGVDLATGTTGKSTLTTLGEGLYANQPLKVGQNEVLLANTIGQFSGNSGTFLQVNNINYNANGSADYVASTSDTDNESKFIDMGINNSEYVDPNFSSMKPYDGYLYVYGPDETSTSGNLVIGTASSFANIVYIVGGTTTSNIVARMTKTDLQLSAGYNIKFGDGSIQSVAASPVNYSQAAFALANNNSVLSQASFNVANTASANTVLSQGTNVTQNTRLTVIEGTDISQNARMTIIEGVDNTQNSRMAIIEGTDVSQNSRMAIIEGSDVSQNSRMTIIEGVDNTQNTNITITNNTALAAFNKANNAVANTSSITLNNSLYVPGVLSVEGTVYSNGATYVANSMSIPTTYSSPQSTITLNYQIANIVKTNITSDLVVAHTNYVLGKNIDLFVYNDSAATRTITHGVPANNSTTKDTTIKVAPYSTKHLKYFTINSDLANTYVIETVSENYINEDIYFARSVTMNGTVVLSNTNFAASEAAFRITATGSSQTPTQAGTLMQLTGKANTPGRMLIDSFGSSQNTAYSIIAGRSARGTVDAPTATQNNDILLRIAGNSYGTTGYAPFGAARIDFVASENQSDTNRGSRIIFYNTPNGSNVINQIASFNADTIEFTGEVNPEKGFIYTPVIYPGAQTAITIDMTNGPLIRAQTTTGLVVTLSNFVRGKVVELWVTNLAGSTQTFTHGVSAINSTTGSTTVSMPGNSTLCARYVCLDGTLANTMVAIIN